jgi:hypothetical protein
MRMLVIIALAVATTAEATVVQTKSATSSGNGVVSGPGVSNRVMVGECVAGTASSGATTIRHGFLGPELVAVAGVGGSLVTTVDFLARPTPNPVRTDALIRFGVGRAGRDIHLGIYDVSGRRVASLEDRGLAAGVFETRWDLRDAQGAPVKAGVFFVRFSVGTFRSTQRLVVVR